MSGEAAMKREHAEEPVESTKRQRTEEPEEAMTPEQSEKIQKVLAAVAEADKELEKHTDEMNKKILVIEAKSNRAKRSAFEKRDKLFLDIPGFWKQAVRCCLLFIDLLAWGCGAFEYLRLFTLMCTAREPPAHQPDH